MKIKLFFCFFLLSVNVWGQIPETNPEETAKKKEINTLKKNGDAYYSDMYHEIKAEDADLAEAQQRSKEMLRAHVVEVFSKRMGMSKEDVRDIWEVLEKNCQNIVVKRGDLFRVFTYVMKNALNPDAAEAPADGGEGGSPTTEIPVVPKSEVKASTVAIVPTAPPTRVPVVAEPKVESKSEPKPEQTPMPKPESKSEPKPEFKPEQTPMPKPEPKEEPKLEPKLEPKSEPAIVVEVPVLCQNLIAKGNFDNVYRYLQQEKTYQRLMYGTAKTMQRPEKCYIVLTDKDSGAIVAVLDKGVSERMNFVTKKMDHFRNYQGGNYKAIFVQEY